MDNPNLQIQDEDIIQKLTTIAKFQGQGIEDVLRHWIDAYETQLRQNPILHMAYSAEEIGAIADRDDIAEHFDDILREMMREPKQD